MKPAPFTLHRPSTVAEAIELLASKPEAKAIAGGQSLVPLLNFRLARPDHLVDLSGIEGLARVDVMSDGLHIGSMVRQRDLLEAEVVAERWPLLAAAGAQIGHAAIRNRGTVGGSVAHADPAAELPAAMLALDGRIVVQGPKTSREIAAVDFFTGWFTTDIADDELIVALRVPTMDRPDTALVEWSFRELARRQGDFAMVLAATVVWRDQTGLITDARVVLGGVAATPVRSGSAEAALIGTSGRQAFGAAAAATRFDLSPGADIHATADYRSHTAEVLVGRCLQGAAPLALEPGSADRTVSIGGGSSSEPDSTPTSEAGDGVRVNGEVRSLDGVPDRRLLADWLRDGLGLTGTHLGCEHGVCGACTVLLDGDPVRSCLVLAHQAAGRSITTIEDVGTPVALHPVQEAFRTHHGLQCGFCTPGMVLTALDLLARIPDPTEQQIRDELSGNLCRCTGYVKIIEAVRAATTTTLQPFSQG